MAIGSWNSLGPLKNGGMFFCVTQLSHQADLL